MNNFKKTLNKVYNIFLSNWKIFLLLGLIYLLVFSAFSFGFTPFNDKFNQGFEMMDSAKMDNALLKIIAIGLISLSLLSSWLLCIHNFFSGVLIHILNNPEINFKLALKQTFKSFWKILGFSVLEFFLIMLGMIFFLIPGIYFLFIFYFALPIMINENLGIFKSIRKAQAVFKSNMWKKISLICLLKLSLFIIMIFFSSIKLDGIVVIADWFVSTLFVYLMVYSESEIITDSPKLISKNE